MHFDKAMSLQCPPGREQHWLKASLNSVRAALLGRMRTVQGRWKGTTAHKNASAACMLQPEIPLAGDFHCTNQKYTSALAGVAQSAGWASSMH